MLPPHVHLEVAGPRGGLRALLAHGAVRTIALGEIHNADLIAIRILITLARHVSQHAHVAHRLLVGLARFVELILHDQIGNLAGQTARHRDQARAGPVPSARQEHDRVEIHVWQGKRFLLPYYEEGGERRPFTPGAKHAAVPLTGEAARPSWPASVPEALRIKALAFKRMTRAPAQGRKRRRKAQGMPIRQVTLEPPPDWP